jgi:CheY-like chemotaxis protein
VPIVALTAAARAEDANAYRKAGMNAVLAKPVNIDDMFETIEKVLTRPAARRAA